MTGVRLIALVAPDNRPACWRAAFRQVLKLTCFHTPLIEPDVRICRNRLSEKTHAIAEAIAFDTVCNF